MAMEEADMTVYNTLGFNISKAQEISHGNLAHFEHC